MRPLILFNSSILKGIRIIVSFLVLWVFMLPVLKSVFSVISGDRPTILVANLVIGILGVGLALALNPLVKGFWVIVSKGLVTICSVIILTGVFYEMDKVVRLPGLVRETDGLGYFDSEVAGFWINDKSTLARLADILENGENVIEWRESSFFWKHGAKWCSCWDGEPIRFVDRKERITLKHGCFQVFGFISIRNSNAREFISVLESELSRMGFYETAYLGQVSQSTLVPQSTSKKVAPDL